MGETKEVLKNGEWSRVDKHADTHDSLTEPNHYHSNGLDVIGFAEMKVPKEQLEGFHRINVLKYITRYDKKGTALVYLNKLIALLEGEAE